MNVIEEVIIDKFKLNDCTAPSLLSWTVMRKRLFPVSWYPIFEDFFFAMLQNTIHHLARPRSQFASTLDLSGEHRNQVWFNLTYTIDWLIKIERRIFLAASFLKWFAWSMLFRSFAFRLIEYSFLNRFSTCITFFLSFFPFSSPPGLVLQILGLTWREKKN